MNTTTTRPTPWYVQLFQSFWGYLNSLINRGSDHPVPADEANQLLRKRPSGKKPKEDDYQPPAGLTPEWFRIAKNNDQISYARTGGRDDTRPPDFKCYGLIPLPSDTMVPPNHPAESSQTQVPPKYVELTLKVEQNGLQNTMKIDWQGAFHLDDYKNIIVEKSSHDEYLYITTQPDKNVEDYISYIPESGKSPGKGGAIRIRHCDKNAMRDFGIQFLIHFKPQDKQ